VGYSHVRIRYRTPQQLGLINPLPNSTSLADPYLNPSRNLFKIQLTGPKDAVNSLGNSLTVKYSKGYSSMQTAMVPMGQDPTNSNGLISTIPILLYSMDEPLAGNVAPALPPGTLLMDPDKIEVLGGFSAITLSSANVGGDAALYT